MPEASEFICRQVSVRDIFEFHLPRDFPHRIQGHLKYGPFAR